MKSKTNPFSYLGLDPHYLRGVPDELVGHIVKSAFRNLISYYHDDKRQFPDDTYDKKQKANFDRRRNEIMDAHQALSTSKGRMKAFAEFRENSISSLKSQLAESGLKNTEMVKLLTEGMLSLILDRVGAISKIQSNNPIGKLSGGRILTSFGSDFREFGIAYEFCLGSGGQVNEMAECRIKSASRVRNAEKQIWYSKGSRVIPSWCAIREKTMYTPNGFTVIGSLGDHDFKQQVGPNPRALLDGESSKLFTGLPFYRLHAERMLDLLISLNTSAHQSSHLVLVDSKGIFYFAGIIRATVTAVGLHGLGGKLV